MSSMAPNPLALFLLALALMAAPARGQQSFSCPYGKRASCLDYGDKICSSFAKCVDQSAVCFDAYTCNYKGFICKTKFDDLVGEYEELLRQHSMLIDQYNELAEQHDDNVEEHNTLVRAYSNLESCIEYAATLEEVRDCT